MAIIEQKKLFTLIETWEDVKNMGMVISCNSQHINPDYKYYFKISKKILDYISLKQLEEIILQKFHGCFYTTYDLKILSDCLYIKVWEWNS